MSAMTANQLRRAWLDFFERHGHTAVSSAGLIPTHPTAPLFTNAGMIPFVPYFLGEETPSFRRATSVQKCVRTADIEIVGTTTRHLTFFEMLGNFSFGDYFKEEAIRLAWELSTEVFGFDGDRIWATVYVDDDEAEEIWRSTIGLPEAHIQRLGDEDNFWEMQKGAPGPCGPNSELYYDRGTDFGVDGGPAVNDERYLEFWNLVFMQFNRQADGSLVDLPSKNVDTGAGFERNLVLLQDVATVFETDSLSPLVATAEQLSETRYGADERSDVSLRIMADHARTVSFLVSDGVFPSNEGRGYVLRRLIRRAVRHAYLLGVEQLVTPALIDTTVELMGEAYPALVQNATFVRDVVVREEERFRETLRAGTNLLGVELDKVPTGGSLPGSVAFLLHDTHGFPLELTREIAAERDLVVDDAGFEAAMAEQKRRAKEARARDGVSDDAEPYAELLEQFGVTEFTGRDEYESKARVLAVFDDGDGQTSIVLDRTPFYAESGGQVGDTGAIRSDTGVAEVRDTRLGVPGVQRHLARLVEGELQVGQEVTAAIDGARRDAIRRNHTATHLLHWALRHVLGEHVKQQGSLVAPDRLRFDFSHYEPMTADEVRAVEDLVNTDVLGNFPARHYETTQDYAAQIGAIAFFGDKYGDIVRVLEAGPHSTELCGGTHVRALGDIGPVKIVSESSIGSNLRRLEAISGFGPIERLRNEEAQIERAAGALGVAADELVDAVERQRAEVKELRDEMKALKRQLAAGRATDLAAGAIDGVVVARLDDLDREALRDLAIAVRDQPGIDAVVLGGAPAEGGVALVAGAGSDRFDASSLIAEAAKTVKGGGGKHPDLAVAGGKDPSAIDAALDQARAAAGLPTEGASAPS
jgi:alanyl-tRNA synthetase